MRIAILPIVALALAGSLAGVEPHTWDNVAIGGGGYTNQVVFHPLDGDLVYVGTDIGGMYRWDPAAGRLRQLIHLAPEDDNLYGCAGIAVHPGDPRIVFYGGGKYRGSDRHRLLKSLDRGESWVQITPPAGAAWDVNNGNTDHRFGRRIAVNPSRPDQLFVGFATSGLWRLDFASANATTGTWTRIAGIPATAAVNGVVFDRNDARHVYVATLEGPVYRSSDNGVSFSAIGSQTWKALDLALSRDGDRLFVACDGAGIRRLDTPRTSTTWALPTGISATGEYRTVECSPHDNRIVITAPKVYVGLNRIAQSGDGGVGFTDRSGTVQRAIGWHPDWSGSAISHFAFHPAQPATVWFTDWYSVHRTDDVFAAPIPWRNDVGIGHEEVVTFSLSALPPNREGVLLLSGHADVSGFAHTALRQGPAAAFSGGGATGVAASTGVAHAPADPTICYLVGSAANDGVTGSAYRSTTAGRTWTRLGAYASGWGAGKVAVAVDDPQNVVFATWTAGIQYSRDGSATLQAASGAPTSGALGLGGSLWGPGWRDILVADGARAGAFHLYNRSDGRLYRSTDRGATWSATATWTTPGSGAITAIASVPGRADHVWGVLGTGLWRWDGTTAARQAAFAATRLVAVGAPRLAGGYPTLFVYGRLPSDSSSWIYRSTDQGASWERINDEHSRVGNVPETMAADPSVFGRVYIGTNGSGVWYGEPAAAGNRAPGIPGPAVAAPPVLVLP